MDYYKDLGVAKSATSEDVKKAYRKLALQYHPDANPGDKTAESNFKKAATAYEILSDPSKRAEYDAKGFVGRRGSSPEPPKQKTQPKPEPEPEPVQANSDEWRSWNWEGCIVKNPSKAQLDTLSCNFFGNGGSGRHILTHLFCTEQELKNGCRKPVLFKRGKVCVRCLGDGDVNLRCPKCKGTASLLAWCDSCQNDRMVNRKCALCHGSGVCNWEIVRLPLVIPPSSTIGSAVTIHGEGEGAPHRAPGNLRVVLLKKQEA